ncbi:MAG: (E)-4-hydroxy-3-methylbut-2-enyl-diphosphate synthase [Chlamydiales bacterium]
MSARWKTREVKVGKVGVGGNNPIRIQSMTTSNTRDVNATVRQIMRLADGGCEIVRVTVQGKKEAEACEAIKNELIKKGYSTPLVADIHFYPPAAMQVCDFADKVRINPGNFVDKRATFKKIEYNEETYQIEIEKLEEKFAPLVEKCKRLKRAIRIGTNHGSLSDRIMNYYGDTPAGMVEAAFEFARVCRKLYFHNFIFSMKASNTKVMIEAYRLLVVKMGELGWDYPLHLGVTEAGEGEEGRVKSAIGIGSLLLEGLGDTIRVSLTEDPWDEIDPCQRLINFAKGYRVEPFSRVERVKKSILPPFNRNGSVVVHVSPEEIEEPDFFKNVGCGLQFGQPIKESGAVDILIVKEEGHEKLEKLKAIGMGVLANPFVISENEEEWEQIIQKKPDVIFFAPAKEYVHYARLFFKWLYDRKIYIPVILQFAYDCGPKDVTIFASSEYGSLLCDELGEGICLQADLPLSQRRELSFSILQGARMRSSKTEFISCPGCGRTLFDLQEVAKRIRKQTDHLPGVKIAIMGCIVNGPGEMADADFGYVGSKEGKIDLYVGKECVERYIDMEEADERLIQLIKKHNRWIETTPNSF